MTRGRVAEANIEVSIIQEQRDFEGRMQRTKVTLRVRV
jgi:hypothetical protein